MEDFLPKPSGKLIAKLKEATCAILNCQEDFLQMKGSVEEMYQIFSHISGVTVNDLNVDKDLLLPSGKAISTSAAAHCLLEMKRTALFLRGIHQAVLDKTVTHTIHPIRILYAGTGPFGTLVIPLLSIYKPGELIVDMLDINSQSLWSLQSIIEALGLWPFIGNLYCADACTFKFSHPYDIVISETMLACLKSEPQVAIMQNLIPQMGADSVFIPQDISIDASLTNPKMEMDRLLWHQGEIPAHERVDLGNLFVISKENLLAIHQRRKITIPESVNRFPVLKLFTSVRVYGDEVLSENDSSITLPKLYGDFRTQNSREVEFWYVQGERPRIMSSIDKAVRSQQITNLI